MINQKSSEIADLRERIRHSAAHVMADVVTQMFPDTKLAIGPPTEDGFYYDFMTDRPFSQDDLQAIEEKMSEIIVADQLKTFREEGALFKDLSFDTISGSGPNGAIVHYRVSSETNRKLKNGD